MAHGGGVDADRLWWNKRFNLAIFSVWPYLCLTRTVPVRPAQQVAQQQMDADNRPSSGPKRHSQIPEPEDNAVPIHIQDSSLPAIHLRIHPITHEGAEVFTASVPDIGSVLRKAVQTCWKLLYNDEAHLFPKNIRSITLYVRPMGGVAYTTGNWLDGENKEIHLSAEYVLRQSKERARDEIKGVLVHEMVHVWQHDGSLGTQGIIVDGRNGKCARGAG